MHWKMFSSTPGLYLYLKPVMGDSRMLKLHKPMKLLVKMENVSFTLWKKHHGLLANPI